MHADDSHNNKPGFFSKIFGHDDTANSAPAGVDPGTTVEPSTPVEADAALSEPTSPVEPSTAPVADVQLQSGTMSDVHATSTGPEALDLSSVTPTPAEALSEEAQSEDNTFQLPDIKSTEPPANPTVDVIMPTDTPEVAQEPATEADDSQAEVIFDSTQPQPEPATSVEGSAQSNEAEVASAAPAISEPPASESTTAEATPEETVLPDVEPPAPPVEEGQAWSAQQGMAEDTPSAAVESVTPTTPESPLPHAELDAAQGSMNTILATHSDLTTDAPQVEETGLAPKSESPITPELEVSAEKVSSDSSSVSNPERQAAVARLQGHIDDLEVNLQKVRDELDALK